MTRAEAEKQPDREALKKEIVAEIQTEQRRKKLLSCAGCLTLELLAILIPVLLVAAMIAKTGLITVPVLTNWLYRPSQPVRQVTPLAGTDSEQIVRIAALKARYEPVLQLLEIGFLESELTTLMQAAVSESSADSGLPLRSIQAAIDPGAIEVFGVIDRSGRLVTVKADIVPQVENGKLSFQVSKLRIGALAVPDKLAALLAPMIDKAVGEVLTSGLSSMGQLTAIELEKGKLILRIHATL